jgi:hypothetical protein
MIQVEYSRKSRVRAERFLKAVASLTALILSQLSLDIAHSAVAESTSSGDERYAETSGARPCA